MLYREGLVKEAFAADGAAETRDAVGGVKFAFEFVVVGELFIWGLLACVRKRKGRGCGTYLDQYLAEHR
jgi:hypothetical protein